MARWNLNTYLYAPKDDDKHRACWRDPYLLEEADQLSQLIRQSSDRGVEFVYAIAPGLDITFSSERDVAALKQKLNQVLYSVVQSIWKCVCVLRSCACADKYLGQRDLNPWDIKLF